jgi:hypothetical protein
MRNIFLMTIAVFIVAAVAGLGCNKEEDEEALRVSNDAGTMSISPGPEQDVNITVESAMPRQGVWIEVSVKGEIDFQVYPQGALILTNTAVNKIKIRNLPRQKICLCTVTVTSKGKSSNKATTSFRAAYK